MRVLRSLRTQCGGVVTSSKRISICLWFPYTYGYRKDFDNADRPVTYTAR